MDEQTSTEQPDSYDEPGDYVYVGEDDRTYEQRSLEVKRGDTHHWPDGAPDYRWLPEDHEDAQAALAEKAEREVVEAVEDGEEETESGEQVPAGATIEGSVKAINDYLDGLKESAPALYADERDRLFAAEQEKPIDDQRKGLLTGRHEPQPDPDNLDGAAGSDLL